MALSDPKLVAAAVACARLHGMNELASVIRLDTTDKVRESVDKLLASPSTAPQGARGDVQLTATWDGGADLDLSLIDAQGKRTSWLGSSTRATVSAVGVNSTSGETLGLAGLPQGNYLLEVARASGRDTGSPAGGTITLRLNGEVRTVNFRLTGRARRVGTLRVFFTSRLEPVDGSGGSGVARSRRLRPLLGSLDSARELRHPLPP